MTRRLLPLLAVSALLSTGLFGGSPTAASEGPPAHRAAPAPLSGLAPRGAPGTWSKVSKSTVGILYRPSLFRTANDKLHVVYARDASDGARISYTTITPNGAVAGQGDVLTSGWSVVDAAPVVVGSAGGGLRTVFGGIRTLASGYWSDGRMYDATSDSAGTAWTLPAEAVGLSHSAYASYGTSGTSLADGTPVAAFPLNSTLTWHVGTSEVVGDQSYTFSACCLYDTTMVRDGDNVWVSWYANGSTAATNGTFVKQILPTVGATQKAPGSSVGSDSLPIGRVAMAARAGAGVFVAYCVGYPTCTRLRLWEVGTSHSVDVPGSKYAHDAALSSGSGGRLWLTWSNNIPVVHAIRTGETGLKLGALRNIGMPRGKSLVYSVAIEGSTGRGDIVINVGDSLWHTQVLAGLALKASPSSWRHGTAQNVTFTVSDATVGVAGATVAVGSRECTTTSAGTCRISFPRSVAAGRYTAAATKTGYAKATATLKVT